MQLSALVRPSVHTSVNNHFGNGGGSLGQKGHWGTHEPHTEETSGTEFDPAATASSISHSPFLRPGGSGLSLSLFLPLLSCRGGAHNHP